MALISLDGPDFAELVDFAYWWSCIGKGLHLQPVQQACFTKVRYLIDCSLSTNITLLTYLV